MSRAARAAARPRGEPLLVLALLVGGWLAMRAVLWQAPFGVRRPSPIVASRLARGKSAAVLARRPYRQEVPAHAANAGPPAVLDKPDARVAELLLMPRPVSRRAPAPAPLASVSPELLPEGATGRQEALLAAAFGHMALAPEIAAQIAAGPRSAAALPTVEPLHSPTAAPAAAGTRWSGDSWVLWRNDSSGSLAAVGPSYGRSQAGAVLRYHLVPSSGYRPVAYARATRALAGGRDSEVAAGLAARPIARLPVNVSAELRVSQGSARREIRPAAFAVTELPPVTLPLGFRAEAYGQAGYVGGRFATLFFDGQARVDKRVARLGREAEVRAGGGVWGGAEKQVSRLDVGPSATVSFRLGQTWSRLAVDYRLRVAGNAAPRSGPSLTFSAGF